MMQIQRDNAGPGWTSRDERESRRALWLLAVIMFLANISGIPAAFELSWGLACHSFCKAVILIFAVYLTFSQTKLRAVRYILLSGVPFVVWNLFALLADGVTILGIVSILSQLTLWFGMAVSATLLPTYKTLQILLKLCLLSIAFYFSLSFLLRAVGLHSTALVDPIPLLYISPDRWGMDTLCLLAFGIILVLNPHKISWPLAILLLLLSAAITFSVIRIYYVAGFLIASGIFVYTRGRKSIIPLTLAAAVIVPLCFIVLANKNTGGGNQSSDENALFGVETDGRLVKWAFLATAANDHPWLGNGPGFDVLMINNPLPGYAGGDPDNDFIALAAGAGWPIAFLLFVGIWAPVVFIITTKRKIAPIFRVTSFLFALAYTGISFTDNPLRNPGSCYPLFVFTGMALRQATMSDDRLKQCVE